MNAPNSVASAARTVEGIARVVEIDGGQVWLEPEQTSSCGSCASSGSCSSGSSQSAPGIGTVANRLAARRFLLDELPAHLLLRVGDRIVIGVDDRALLKGALIAYALPLLTALGLAGLVQDAWGSDALSILGMAVGLAIGLGLARLCAGRLSRRGALAPRFLRRALPGETCATL